MAEIFFEVIFSKWVLNGSGGWNTLFFTQFNDFWVFWRHLWDHKCKKWPKQVIFSLPDFFQMTYRVDIHCFWLIVWSKSAIDWLSARSASTLIKSRAIWVLNFIRANGRWRTLVVYRKSEGVSYPKCGHVVCEWLLTFFPFNGFQGISSSWALYRERST